MFDVLAAFRAQRQANMWWKEPKKKHPQLVDLAEFKRLMSELDLGDKKRNEYINARWLNYVEWWDFRSATAKRNT